MSGLLAVGGAVCLVLASSGTAGRVDWNEAAKAKGINVMTYTVDSLTFDAKGWRAHVSLHNVSHVTVGVGVRREFGVAFFTDPKTQTLSQGSFVLATTLSPKPPTSLRPGDSWSGTIGGTGRLTTTQRVYARVVFGPFSGLPGTSAAVVWITDHAMTLGKGSRPQTPAPGPVI
jgi:hypothetical protein